MPFLNATPLRHALSASLLSLSLLAPILTTQVKAAPVSAQEFQNLLKEDSVHDKFHRTLILSGFCLLKIAKISLNSSFFPKPIKR